MNKNKNLGFTLAEVLIVIGIIGVVAALTLPNLNHATGDKETVTRLQKAYSILNEANDRAVAIYGPISSWKSNTQCAENLNYCWMQRIGEFLKISKSCTQLAEDDALKCDDNILEIGDMNDFDETIYQMPDGISFGTSGGSFMLNCDGLFYNAGNVLKDICMEAIGVDVNGPSKGKNENVYDIFQFMISDSLGVLPYNNDGTIEDSAANCIEYKSRYSCTWWTLEYGNLDYLKADENGKCNDSNIILDGTTNTSCH